MMQLPQFKTSRLAMLFSVLYAVDFANPIQSVSLLFVVM